MQIFKIISLFILLGAVFIAGVMFIQEKSDKGYTKERAKQGEQVSRGIGIGLVLGTAVGLIVNRENLAYFTAIGLGIGILVGLLKGRFGDQK